jgi:hypothetical protein
MSGVTTIPVLPCASLPETLAFYQALGFEVTHEQSTPNVYGAIRRGEINLHFMGIKGLNPAEAYSVCLVMVPEVEGLHRIFAAGLREAYGRLPLAGRPRISRIRPGQSRFTVVDVAGNSVIYIKQDAPGDYDEGMAPPPTGTRLDSAMRTAARLRDFKNDDAAAAKVLEAALRKEPGDPFERARALLARAEIAIAQGDMVRAHAARTEVDQLPLDEQQRQALAVELDRLSALERTQV